MNKVIATIGVVLYLALAAGFGVCAIDALWYRKEALTLRHRLAVDEVKLANQEPDPVPFSFGQFVSGSPAPGAYVIRYNHLAGPAAAFILGSTEMSTSGTINTVVNCPTSGPACWGTLIRSLDCPRASDRALNIAITYTDDNVHLECAKP